MFCRRLQMLLLVWLQGLVVRAVLVPVLVVVLVVRAVLRVAMGVVRRLALKQGVLATALGASLVVLVVLVNVLVLPGHVAWRLGLGLRVGGVMDQGVGNAIGVGSSGSGRGGAWWVPGLGLGLAHLFPVAVVGLVVPEHLISVVTVRLLLLVCLRGTPLSPPPARPPAPPPVFPPPTRTAVRRSRRPRFSSLETYAPQPHVPFSP